MTDRNASDGSTQRQLDELFSDFDPAAWPVIAESNQGLIVHVTTKTLNLAVKVPRGRGLMWHARRLSLLREQDRKSTRLNSSHVAISYAVFCLKKKKSTDRSVADDEV